MHLITIMAVAGCGDDGGDMVPPGAYCDAVSDWPDEWAALEEEVLAMVNTQRAQGASCGDQGVYEATGPLTMDPALRCAARLHSMDMNERDFFEHENPDGELPWDRMERAGYTRWRRAAENIAVGSTTAAGAMGQWMGSDGHCGNIMSPEFTDIGIGYYDGALWTQVFGTR